MNDNKDFYEKFYKEKTNSHSKSISGIARYFFYLTKSILKYIDPDYMNNILEVGCGRGSHTIILSKYFNNSKVIGIDFANSGIELAKENYSEYSNLFFINEEFDNFIYNSDIKKFDLIASFEVLEHIEDWETLLKKMIMASNKYVLISVPVGKMRDWEKNIGHFRNFKKGEIEEFMNNNGFKTVKTFYAGFPFYSPFARDYANKNFDNLIQDVVKDFSIYQKIFHYLAYISFRYFSLKSYGDAFYGLFEKENLTINSNGGVNYNFLFLLNLETNYIVKAFIYIKIYG
ncbi:bifunctional 2-polyprenyl-6-hydroxyphenol methylase/3-demethylubiquinol 3-O-methyltransferase UbiG [uncultured Brachyspira sp.]|uniref:class I SAM-dependent methyltransferase n=1 Tax=uncultured Brachyspira sp. TaxID=221953 RepID=UPI0026371208|nr:class I SAM-dependent methyltransferase [uncultured Brachyspira sp.]